MRIELSEQAVRDIVLADLIESVKTLDVLAARGEGDLGWKKDRKALIRVIDYVGGPDVLEKHGISLKPACKCKRA